MEIGRLLGRASLLAVRVRGIATSGAKMQKALEKLQTNPYYEKYAERIARLQQSDPEEFLERVSRRAAPAPAAGPVETSQYSSVLNPKKALSEAGPVEEKKLNAILKLDLVKDKNAAEIESLWREYHKDKEVISATIPIEAYKSLSKSMNEFPTFLFPLPRSQGYEFFVCQSLGHSVHFTPLLAFQVHKENAPECLTMVHYTELRDKGIVLMRGEYDKKVVSAREAQCLASQLQLYHGAGAAPARRALLRAFAESPHSFRHMDLIAQLEAISLE